MSHKISKDILEYFEAKWDELNDSCGCDLMTDDAGECPNCTEAFMLKQVLTALSATQEVTPDVPEGMVLVPRVMLKARLQHGPQCADIERCADCSEALGCVDECPHTALTAVLAITPQRVNKSK